MTSYAGACAVMSRARTQTHRHMHINAGTHPQTHSRKSCFKNTHQGGACSHQIHRRRHTDAGTKTQTYIWDVSLPVAIAGLGWLIACCYCSAGMAHCLLL